MAFASVLQRAVICFLLATFTLVNIPVNAQSWLSRDTFGQFSSFVMPVSSSQEVAVGRQLDQQVRKKYKLSSNAAVQAYVSRIGQHLAKQTGSPYSFSYTVVVDNQSVNAFAGPGGFIYVTTGLLKLLNNESQLAGVLAHETAHVMQRHVIRQLQQRQTTSLALSVLQRVSSIDLDPRLANIGQYLLAQRFSREDESEADLVGARLMVKAGYNPKGLVAVLHKLNSLEQKGMRLSFLQSHPSSSYRASHLQNYIQSQRLVKPGLTVDSPQFHNVFGS